MGEYAQMEIDSHIGDWGSRDTDYGDDEEGYIPASAWIPKGADVIVGELISEKETEKAFCIRFVRLKDNDLQPAVYVPKSKTKLAKDKKTIWMPYWLIRAKMQEIKKQRGLI